MGFLPVSRVSISYKSVSYMRDSTAYNKLPCVQAARHAHACAHLSVIKLALGFQLYAVELYLLAG